MNFIEDMLCMLVEDIFGISIIKNIIKDVEGNVMFEVEYDFGKLFDCLSMGEVIFKYWLEVNEEVICDLEVNFDVFKVMVKQFYIKEFEVDGIWGVGKYFCEIFEVIVEEKFI